MWFQAEARAGRVGEVGSIGGAGSRLGILRTPSVWSLSVRGPHSVAASGQLDCFLGNSALHTNQEETALFP